MDTPRTLLEILALFGNNTTEDISPQDLRDFVVTAMGGYGGLYATASGALTINIAAAKPNIWTGTFPSSGTTPSAADDAIVVAVAGDYVVDVDLAFLGTAAGTFTFQVYKEGAAVTGMVATRTLASATDVTNVSIGGIITCAADDELTVYVSCLVDASSITVKSGQFRVVRRA